VLERCQVSNNNWSTIMASVLEDWKKKRPKASLNIVDEINNNTASLSISGSTQNNDENSTSNADPVSPKSPSSNVHNSSNKTMTQNTSTVEGSSTQSTQQHTYSPLRSPRVSKDGTKRKVFLTGTDACPNAKMKLDHLLYLWLLRPETCAFIQSIEDGSDQIMRPSKSFVRQHSGEIMSQPLAGSPASSAHPPSSSASMLSSQGSSSHQHSMLGSLSQLSLFISTQLAIGKSSTKLVQSSSFGKKNQKATEMMAVSQSSDDLEKNLSRTMSSSNSLTTRRKYNRTLSTQITKKPSISSQKEETKVEVPRFYVPYGEGDSEQELMELELLCDFFNLPQIRDAEDDFAEEGAEQVEEIPRVSVSRPDFAEVVVEIFGLPSFYSSVLFDRLYAEPANIVDVSSGRTDLDPESVEQELTRESVFKYYEHECKGRSRPARLFYALLNKSSRNYLGVPEIYELVESLLVCHPGLSFLQATPEFQQRYAETVVERIFFSVSQNASGRIYLKDVVDSEFLDTLMEVDEEEDINRERKYFSYEHFYVLYCRFWELDTDHDLLIDREDLLRYNGHALTCRIVDRIFEGRGRPLDSKEPGYMGYTDFIWFCLCEEDKTSRASIDYWFRCIDLDGDGVLSLYEMEFFYMEQLHRMECLGHEAVKLPDIVCQILDMVKPKFEFPLIRRKDLRKSRVASHIFNMLFNLNKFFTMESRDPIQLQQERATPHLTEWDRFAQLEYMRLSEEEEDEYDEDEDEDDGALDDTDEWEEVDDSELAVLGDKPVS